MLPLVPFAAGVLAGAVVVKLIRTGKAQAGLAKTGSQVREATVSGLAAIERASAYAREKLAAQESAPAAPAAQPKAKRARKRARPAKGRPS